MAALAATSLRAPKAIKTSMVGSNERIYRDFKEDFQYFKLSAGYKSKDDDEKIALLINLGGEEFKEIYRSLTWAAPTEAVPDEWTN